MSFLTPLYLVGLAAVSLPIVFHFLRRAPRGVLPYSSLMFLSASPPRLTRRSRIDHWLLLMLRALALILLAIAFCRPFLRKDSALPWETSAGRRVAVLLDTSASMRRAGLWQQAEQALDDTLKQLKPEDTVALFSFDRQLRTVADFSSSEPLAAEADAVRKAFKPLQPSWNETALGAALASLAERIVSIDDQENSEQALQIILISDLQQGVRLETLQAMSWPERVSVDVRRVVSDQPNASIHVLERSLMESDPLAARLRVAHDNSQTANYQLRWETVQQQGESEAVEVPAQGSKVIRSRRPDAIASADRVTLSGDAHDFDNVCFVLPPLQRQIRLLFWGDETETDAEGLRFYLQNAAATAPQHELKTEQATSKDLPQILKLVDADLVVVTQGLAEPQAARARQAVLAGARLLIVLRDAEWPLDNLLPEGGEVQLTEADNDYSLWSDIDFDHPVFAPLASARYNDFTKVRFWRHRRVEWTQQPKELRVVARFDSGDLAIGQWSLGKGEVTLMTSGWNPQDSKLALSTKFVPLAAGLLDRRREDRSSRQFGVMDSVPRSTFGSDAQQVSIVTPQGDVVALRDDEEAFFGADEPGIYQARWADQQRMFAVNLTADESRTSPLPEGELARHGVRLGQSVALGQVERQRQRHKSEMEKRQKLWQWLIVAALAILVVETLLAAAYARRVDLATTET